MQTVLIWHNNNNTMCLLSVPVKQLQLTAEWVILPQVWDTRIAKDNYTRLDIASDLTHYVWVRSDPSPSDGNLQYRSQKCKSNILKEILLCSFLMIEIGLIDL